MKEEFSIVIPVYNREKELLRCLSSVQRQTYRPLRVILVDNGSEDGSMRILEDWKEKEDRRDFRIDVVSDPRGGACRARNFGLELVESKWMCFFDSDDEMCPRLVEDAVGKLRKCEDENNGIVIWRVAYERGGEMRKLRRTKGNVLRSQLFHSIMSTQRYAGSTLLYRRAGGWNEDLSCWNDWEYGVRILIEQPEVKWIDKVEAIVHWTERSITGKEFSARGGSWEKSIDAVEMAMKTCGKEFVEANLPVLGFRRGVLSGLYLSEIKGRKGCEDRREEAVRRLSEDVYKSGLRGVGMNWLRRQMLRVIRRWAESGTPGASTLLGWMY
ncbi:MAG: glycosyltransferase family 2 protein [Prevotella sp.]|nr:glycosyltransferase family 2 protein [Bacteroides sp.]MCM1366859.1 glycosyltransferase family 2 protein [Prevotella sp.]MCM1437415.1 glycosyltransferase family 2 protein [Prevotella sp.]